METIVEKRFFEERFLKLRISPTLRANMKQSNCTKKVFKLAFGQSPFPVPQIMVDELKKNAHLKHYGSSQGELPLRKAVSGWLKRKFEVDYPASRVIISSGSKFMYYLFQMVFDGEIFLLSPCWVSYKPQSEICGKQAHVVPCKRGNTDWTILKTDNKYFPKIEDFEAFLRNLEKQNPEKAHRFKPEAPKLLIINFPNNPTGMIPNSDYLKNLAEFLKRENFIVLSDEIYSGLNYEDSDEVSLAQFSPERTVLLGGISKWAGAGGWRVGFAAIPPLLEKSIPALTSILSETISCVATPIQIAACMAFQDSPEIEDYILVCRRTLSRIGCYMATRFRQIGAEVLTPRGAFYMYPDFSKLLTAELRAKHGIKTSEDFQDLLFQRSALSVLPGMDFQRDEEEMGVRIAFTDFDGGLVIRDFLPELRNAGTESEREKVLSKILEEGFLVKYAPNLVKAMDKFQQLFEEL